MERDYGVEAAEIAAGLGYEWGVAKLYTDAARFEGRDGEYMTLYYDGFLWPILLRLVRQQRRLPETVPEGHERVHMVLRRTSSGSLIPYLRGEPQSVGQIAARVVVDVPEQQIPELIGSVEK